MFGDSIVLLPHVFDFLPRKSVKKGLSLCVTITAFFIYVFTLKIQIKTASLEGAQSRYTECFRVFFLSLHIFLDPFFVACVIGTLERLPVLSCV